MQVVEYSLTSKIQLTIHLLLNANWRVLCVKAHAQIQFSLSFFFLETSQVWTQIIVRIAVSSNPNEFFPFPQKRSSQSKQHRMTKATHSHKLTFPLMIVSNHTSVGRQETVASQISNILPKLVRDRGKISLSTTPNETFLIAVLLRLFLFPRWEKTQPIYESTESIQGW